MKISHFCIDRPVFASVLSIVITLAGGVALYNLPIAQYPEIAPVEISVTATLDAVNRRVSASRTYLEMAQMRYEEGYISFIEVLDAQRTLFEAETTQAEVQGRVFNFLVNLYKALGGGWVVEAEDMALGEARRMPASQPPGGPMDKDITTPPSPPSRPISGPSPKPGVEPGTAFPPIPPGIPAK